MNKYIWEKEVKTIQEDNIVVFADDTTKYFTDKELAYSLTDEPKDATAFRDLMLDTIVPKMLEVFDEYNIRKWDIQLVIQEIVSTYNNTFNIAVGKAFWTFEEWKHSDFFPEEIRISEIKTIKEFNI